MNFIVQNFVAYATKFCTRSTVGSWKAATNLLYRIHERNQQLRSAVFVQPERLAFDPTGVAQLTNWLATVEGGRVTFIETNSGGGTSLQIRFGSGGKSALAPLGETRVAHAPFN